MQLAGYQLTGILYTGGETTVATAQSPQGERVALKYPESEQPAPALNARWRHEYGMLRAIDSPWVIKALGLHEVGHRLVLVLENFSPLNLSQVIEQGLLDLGERLGLAMQLTQALSAVHQARLIHGDIAPKNVLVDLASLQLKLCDFALSTRLAHGQTQPAGGGLRGTLDYIAPEQTGRTNLEVDYRSDFYSLGVSLYELFSGHKPFQLSDPIALLHAQVALMPPPLDQLGHGVPAPLAAIVQKLLAKYPDDRYQSSYGLLKDLQRCAEQWQQQRRIEAFALASEDIPERFCVSQKLYGRAADVLTLREAFARASAGHAELLLIGGSAGVGKTALAAELHRPVVAQRGYFLRGKCDQYSHQQPYAALSQAFQLLMQQLASEGAERRRYWQASLGKALGDAAAAVAAIVPGLSLLIGTPAPLTPLPVAEHEQRFHLAFARFVKALAAPAHPLLLFIDDLQWVDAPSLRLLRRLINADEAGACLLVVGAYRDNEVDAAHPLAQLLEQQRQLGTALLQLTLQPLGLPEVQALLADTLRAEGQRVAPLAALCLEKTRGNPFFLGQFLRSLHVHGDLHYERAQGAWQWDIEQIARRGMTDNVVTLMLERLRGLPPTTQTLLTRAAQLGDSFCLRELMALLQADAGSTAAMLWPALEAGLLLPMDEDYKFEHSPALMEAARYRFLHDRVQQAAHELTPEPERQAMLLHCGRQLLACSPGALLDERLFNIVDCLNQALALISAADERALLLRLNVQAGLRAKNASAHGAAVALLRQARALLPEQAWQHAPDETLALFTALAEAEYLAGHFDAAERLYPEVMAACPLRLGRVSICLVQADQYHIQGRFADAFPVLLQAMALLGQPFPASEEEAQALFPAEFERTEALLQRLGPSALLQAAEMQAPERLMEMRVYYALSYASYQTGRFAAFVLDACRMVQTTLAHGQGDLSCIAYVAYLTAMSVMHRPYTQCHALGRLAMRLAEQRGGPYYRITVYQYFSAFYQHWGEPLAEAIAQVELGLELGQGGVNPLAAGYCALLGAVNRFALGEELAQLEARCQQGLRFLQKTRQPNTELMLRHGVLQPLQALRGKTLGALSFDTEDSASSTLFADAAPSIPLALYSAAMLRHAYLMGDRAQWQACVARQAVIGMCLPDSPSMVEACFYTALGQLRPGFVDAAQQAEAVLAAEQQLARFAGWAEGCAANFHHKQALIAAELARVRGEDRAAMDFYAQAIDAAAAAGFTACEALANELYAEFWAAQQQRQLSSNFIREAHYHYRRWGALVKCLQLEARWPHISFGQPRPSGGSGGSGGSAGRSRSSGSSYRDSLEPGASLDLHSLLKANQLLAQEIHLDTLLPQMLGVLLEHAGAEFGAIVLDEDESLVVEVMGAMAPEQQGDMQRLCMPLEELGEAGQQMLPAGLIEYVRLTRRTLVLNRPAEDERFSHSACLQRRQIKSLVCLPVLSQGKPVALVYLENNQLENAFTTQHLQTLELLSSQAAISLVNARLYESLEHKVAQRTEELRQMSMKDGLTGIANRRAFDERLALEWRRSQRQGSPLSLLMVDIDHFKQYNDCYGHLEGDRCIRAVASVLSEVAGRGGDLVARYGGEEFALLLPDTDAPAAARLAQACLDATELLAMPHAQSLAGPLVSISLGCATLVATPLSSPEHLLGQADAALYQAKRAGRRRWQHHADTA